MKVVLKLGGSLLKEAKALMVQLVQEFEESKTPEEGKTPVSILIVPGGGMFADTVRKADQSLGLSQDAAHWMAVLGMEQYACYLLDKTGALAVDSIQNLPYGVRVFLPFKLLKKEDPLPHSWDVTSDTIAAWAAKSIGARLVKVTNVDGIFKDGRLLKEISTSELQGDCKSCVDLALPAFLQNNSMECMIVNGKFPERVIGAIYGKPVLGTVIKGNI
jgi:aspartokinase-like uncharacterized kinase